jgi:hypothetical protein
MDQLRLEHVGPQEPKPGTVKASIMQLLRQHPEGLCRRNWAQYDIYEVSARIGELQRDGWVIGIRRCSRHDHRKAPHMVEYFL